MIVACEQRHEPQRDARRDPAGERPADDQHREARQGIADRGVGHVEHDVAHEHAEQRNRSRIVEQAFPLDDPHQAPRCRNRTENTHHRRGIGGRYDSADQQTGRERQRAGPNERVAHRERCHHNRHYCQHQYRHPVVEHSQQIHAERGLEQQRRQEHIEKRVCAYRQIENRLRNGIQSVCQLGVEKKRSPRTDQNAQHGEHRGVGQMQPGRQWLGRRNDQEQRGDNRGKYDDIHKECTFAVAMGRLRRSRPSARQGIRATCAALPEASVYPPATARCGTTPGTQANRTNARVANRSARSFPRNHMQEACSEPLDLVWWAQPGRQDSGIRESSVEGGIGAGSGKLQGQPLGCCRGTPEPTHFWGVPLC